MTDIRSEMECTRRTWRSRERHELQRYATRWGDFGDVCQYWHNNDGGSLWLSGADTAYGGDGNLHSQNSAGFLKNIAFENNTELARRVLRRIVTAHGQQSIENVFINNVWRTTTRETTPT